VEDSLHTPSCMDLDLDIAPDLTAPAQARHAVAALGDHLDTDVVSDIVLLVSELVSNSVKYGDGTIGVRVRTLGRRQVVVEVTDEGGGFERQFRPASRCEAGGYGLRLVDRLSDNCGVHGDTAHIWFEIDRSDEYAAVA
jgi:two-component sensor histidine kinase